jgi:hypothetical protein
MRLPWRKLHGDELLDGRDELRRDGQHSGQLRLHRQRQRAVPGGLHLRRRQLLADVRSFRRSVPGSVLRVRRLYTCTHTCNPVSPGTSSGPYGACGPNINCFPSTSGASGCLGPTGSGTQGGYCDDPNYNPDQTQCAAGYVCLNDGLFNDCYQFCRVGMNDCPPLYTCYSFVNPEYAGPTEIGYCY